jgi:hypothetical protein
MNNIEFFNLRHDGESAIVRILNTDVNEIEVKGIHYIDLQGKKKAVACLGEGNCPLCDVNQPVQRLCVHLWDYTDNKEKIWSRTPNQNFLNSLSDVVDSWGDLCDSVVKITRNGDNFPKYTITVLNPNKYPFPDSLTKDSINEKVAYRLATYRSAEELEEFVRTGFLPDHVKKQSNWVPKEEWIKRKKEEEKNNSSSNTTESSDSKLSTETDVSDFDDPFM